MFSKIFEAMYVKVFVNIVPKRSSTVVYIETATKKGVQRSAEEEFQTVDFNDKMYEFITAFTKESPYYYISVIDTYHPQGAVPTCAKAQIDYYYIDTDNVEFRCYDDQWAYLTGQENLTEIKKKYRAIGLDYIFSPFSVLSYFFKDKINTKLATYVLIEEGALALAIFDNSRLLYAKYLIMMGKDDFDGIDDAEFENDTEDIDLFSEEEDSIDLDDIDLEDDTGEIEDFASIEDLDAIEDIEEFSDNKDIEEELMEIDETPEESDETEFNEDYQRFTLIQSAISEFYKDPRYESHFIENVYVADTVGLTHDLKRYLEEEMFFNVYIRRMDLALEMCELAKEEIGL